VNHTPGPWEAFEVLSEAYYWRWGVRIGTESAWRLCEGLPEADARLIAAAPVLLAALEEIVNLEGFADQFAYRAEAIALEAIAKAKGEASAVSSGP
jgi:hypothetical protein